MEAQWKIAPGFEVCEDENFPVTTFLLLFYLSTVIAAHCIWRCLGPSNLFSFFVITLLNFRIDLRITRTFFCNHNH